MKPSVSPIAMALPDARKGKRPTEVSWPRSLACASVRPRLATWGLAVDGARHVGVVERLGIEAGDLLNRGDALMRGDVGEEQLAGDVADGPDTGDVGLTVVVDLDPAAIELDAGCLEAEGVGVGAEADADEDLVSG